MRLLFFLGLFAVVFSGEVIGDTPGEALVGGHTNPAAIELCRGLVPVLRNPCLALIKGHSYEPEAVGLCSRLRWDTAKTLCLYHVRNEPFKSKPLLEACYDPNEWHVLDCIKGIADKPKAPWAIYSGKLSTVLDFWAQDYPEAEDRATETIGALNPRCLQYRTVSSIKESWFEDECPYSSRNNAFHCQITVHCVAD